MPTRLSPRPDGEVRTRTKVSPQFSRDLDRFTQFLTLVGLTALIIGGVGVANAIRAFVARNRRRCHHEIARCDGRPCLQPDAAQVMLIAALGIAIGSVLGAALPFLAAPLFATVLPFSPGTRDLSAEIAPAVSTAS